MKIIKKILSVVIILILIALVLYIIFLASFSYMITNKSSREELKKNYYENKNEFVDLISFFDSVIPINYENHKIIFGNGDNNAQFNLLVMPYDNVIKQPPNFLGGDDLEFGSAKLDSALYELKWDKMTLTFLSEKLRIINCSKITTEPTHKSYFIISDEDGGLGVYTYRIFKQPLTDSLFKIYGEPVGKNGFDRKVVIHYDTPF